MDRLDIKRNQIATAMTSPNVDEQSRLLHVAHVMTAAPRTVASNLSVLELVRLLKTNRFRHLLVCDASEKLIGVLSDRDVVRCFGPNRYPDENALRSLTAGDIMSEDLITVGPTAPILTVVQIMIEHGISCLPVVDAGRPLGIITNTDLHLLLECLIAPKRQPVESAVLN